MKLTCLAEKPLGSSARFPSSFVTENVQLVLNQKLQIKKLIKLNATFCAKFGPGQKSESQGYRADTGGVLFSCFENIRNFEKIFVGKIFQAFWLKMLYYQVVFFTNEFQRHLTRGEGPIQVGF